MNSYRYNTINYYNANADDYFKLTSNKEMNEIIDKFSKYLKRDSLILDFGCGSGRDTLYFKKLGFKVNAIDGSKNMCALASQYINQEVKCIDFLDFNEINVYDGIWACASLLHLNKKDLLAVLKLISLALKKDGYIYTCFKDRKMEEIDDIDDIGRYYLYCNKKEYIDLINSIGLKVIEEFETISELKNVKTKWLNFIIKKI